MVRPGILGKEARPQKQGWRGFLNSHTSPRCNSSFRCDPSEASGVQLPDFVILIEALGFVVGHIGRDLVPDSRCAGAPGERRTLPPDGQPHPGDFLDARR